jgi:hypothetical protein
VICGARAAAFAGGAPLCLELVYMRKNWLELLHNFGAYKILKFSVLHNRQNIQKYSINFVHFAYCFFYLHDVL